MTLRVCPLCGAARVVVVEGEGFELCLDCGWEGHESTPGEGT